jgi:hypothetical protein
VIQVPEQQHELDRLAREVADAALAAYRHRLDQKTAKPINRLPPNAYRLELAVQRYEQAVRQKEKP